MYKSCADHVQIMHRSSTYQYHLQITYRSSTYHLQITYRSSTYHLQIIYRSLTDHLHTIYSSSIDHLHIIYRSYIDHLQIIYRSWPRYLRADRHIIYSANLVSSTSCCRWESGVICMIYSSSTCLPGFDLPYKADPAQPLTTAAEELLNDLSVDI